jgi:multiple antibiotic resistance protein
VKTFWLCFVPLFVAVDPIGVLPLFMGLTRGAHQPYLGRLVLKSMLTAAVVSLLFLLGGGPFLAMLGVTVNDFSIAGGILLFAFSITDILSVDKSGRVVTPTELAELGVVPIGVPLIAGPALLTTIILLREEHGILPSAAALLVNIGLAGLCFLSSKAISRALGVNGVKLVSKIANLLLASIAVMLVRKGIMSSIGK